MDGGTDRQTDRAEHLQWSNGLLNNIPFFSLTLTHLLLQRTPFIELLKAFRLILDPSDK